MAALLAPYLLICGFIIAQPNIGPLGLLSAVYLAVSTHIDNNSAQTYDTNAFFNTTLAILLGIGVSVALFRDSFPETPQWAARRFFRLVLHKPEPAYRRPSTSLLSFQLCSLRKSRLDPRAILKTSRGLHAIVCSAGEIGLSSAWAIERTKNRIGPELPERRDLRPDPKTARTSFSHLP